MTINEPDFFEAGQTVQLDVKSSTRAINPNARPVSGGWLIDCEVCGTETKVKTEWAKFCSSSCRQKAHRKKQKDIVV